MKVRLQHVSIPRPPGSENLTRAFYGELLGLEEIPVPPTIRQFDLIWFALGPETELHVFAEEAFSDQSGRHFCLVVEDLNGLKHKLVEAGIETWEPAAILSATLSNSRPLRPTTSHLKSKIASNIHSICMLGKASWSTQDRFVLPIKR